MHNQLTFYLSKKFYPVTKQTLLLHDAGYEIQFSPNTALWEIKEYEEDTSTGKLLYRAALN
ncbi:hypothetical protein DZA37_00850 [Kangiella sp. HD9-110m-PIT-SAG06]|nr:hypothetical protein DZA37_00850 [Kangiella sp. HD9-110m-PIT-SAG06]